MRLPVFLLLSVLSAIPTASAQVELVLDSYFPADLEFKELRKITSEETFENPSRLSKIEGGRLFLDVGFDKYARRVYAVENSGSLSIEVVTLKDSRAAYSLLTLLRNSSIQSGPPGDAFTTTVDAIRFAQGREWIRIQGPGISANLMRRIADSISHRIGPTQQRLPSLISHFPKLGYDASSLRYFPGSKSYESFLGTHADKYLKVDSDMEIAQAQYSLENQNGILSLLSFPTAQVAEDYFSQIAPPKSAEKGGNEIYVKRTGPLVAILEGTFDPSSADRILSLIKHSYSIRWIYEKPKAKTVWGVPVVILGTVVKSLFFVVILGGISIVAGVGFGVFRFVLRVYAPQNPLDRPERTEITRLRLR